MTDEVTSPMLAVELATCAWFKVPHSEFLTWPKEAQTAAIRSWLRDVDEGRP